MNFIDKLNVLIGNGERATAAGSRCWPDNGRNPFGGTLMPPVSGELENAVYSFPRNDPCITRIIRNTTGMCDVSGARLPCCMRQAGGKCVEIRTWFIIPTASGTPSGHGPDAIQVSGGSPILKKCVIHVLPSGYEVSVPRVKYQTILFDGTNWDHQGDFLNR